MTFFRYDAEGSNNRYWYIETPLGQDFSLGVNNDDCDRFEAARHMERMLAILNAHWDSPEFPLRASPCEEDEDEDARYEARREAMEAILDGLPCME